MTKRVMILAVLVFFAAMIPILASAETQSGTRGYILTRGTCGDNLTWTLDDGGLLTISGTGAMYEYTGHINGYAPWGRGPSRVVIEDGVTSIGRSAFEDSGLTSVTIPDSVTSIGDYAFSRCYMLKSVTIPDSVTSIGVCAFDFCINLTSVTIPNSVTSIGDWVFSYCSSLTSVTIGNSVTSISEGDFSCCSNLTNVTIGNSVTNIDWSAFAACSNLTNVTIPDSVTSIGGYAFVDCSSMTSVTIGNSVTSIGEAAFSGCSRLTSVTIPDSVTNIDDIAFSGCIGLTSVTIGNSVTSIGEAAFSGCSRLTSVTIPDSVTNIDDIAFSGCSSMTSVTIPASVTSIGDNVFSSCASDLTLWVYNPSEALSYAQKNNINYKIINNTITWLNDDGSIIDTTIVEYGEMPTHADPVKPNTKEYTYTFAGWDPEIIAVTGPATYKATFASIKTTSEPTAEPTVEPTAEPTAEPTMEPTVEPTIEPTADPTAEPTTEPTMGPTVEPTIEPTAEPTTEPIAGTTAEPTPEPTVEPTMVPTEVPTATPSVTSTPKAQNYYLYGNTILNYLLSSGRNLVFTVKRAQADENTFSLFLRILIDHLVVDRSYYTVSPGSVIIDLKPTYLETLSTGKHILTVVFEDGEVEIPFEVSKSVDPASFHDVAVPSDTFTFKKAWQGDHEKSIDFTLYKADGSVYHHGFNKRVVSDTEWRYNAYFSSPAACYVIEKPVPGYQVKYVNVGVYADVTDRCCDGGTIINKKIPKTGDAADFALWAGIIALGTVGLTATVILTKRKKAHK